MKTRTRILTEKEKLSLGELQLFRRLITELYPKGIVSVVSDTWDFWEVVTKTVSTLKADILSRDGKLVIRPDSGDPVKIICGTAIDISDTSQDTLKKYYVLQAVCRCGGSYFQISKKKTSMFRREDIYEMVIVEPTPEMKGAVQCLWDVFGGTTTDKGFRVLDSHIGLIYGDSITLHRAAAIMSCLKANNFASNNVVFGVGSYTYEYVTRDTFGFAVKSTYGEINGVAQEIFKDPVTDSGVKKSAKGLLRVNEDLTVSDRQTPEQEAGGMLKLVFEDGKLIKETSLAEIRARLTCS